MNIGNFRPAEGFRAANGGFKLALERFFTNAPKWVVTPRHVKPSAGPKQQCFRKLYPLKN